MLVQTAYDILGVNRSSTVEEIKKAYFRLVRKYNPNENPEGFKALREAYELLKNGPIEEDGPSYAYGSEAEEALVKRIHRALGDSRYKEVTSLSMQGIQQYPAQDAFVYYLAIGEMKTGHTGKAAKTMQELVAKDPENAWYQRGLGMAYFGRNWKNKAFLAFQKALSVGAHDPEFISTYMRYAKEERYWGEYFRCLDTFYTHPVTWTRDYAQDIIYIMAHTENRKIYPEETCKGVISFVKELILSHQDILESGYMVCKLLYEVETHAPEEMKGQIREIYPEVLEKTLPMDRDEGGTPYYTTMQYRGALVQSYLHNTLGTSASFARTVDDYIFETKADTDFPTDLRVDNQYFIYDDPEGAIKSLPFLEKCVPGFVEKYAADFNRLNKGKSEIFRMKKKLNRERERLGGYVRSEHWNNLIAPYNTGGSSGGSYGDGSDWGFGNEGPSEQEFYRILEELMRRQRKSGGNDFPFPFF